MGQDRAGRVVRALCAAGVGLVVLSAAGRAAADLPAPLLAEAQDNAGVCRESGGSPSFQGVRVPGAEMSAEVHVPYVTAVDLNGDGQDDYVTDLAGLDCVNAWSLFCGSAGCPVKVWLSGAEGLTPVWAGHAQGWRLDGAVVVLALHGQLCTPPRVGADGCEVALRFEAAAAPPPQPAPVPAPAAPSAGWSHGQTADVAGWYAGVVDPATGGRVDWLCAAGREAWLALSPHAGGSTVTIDVGGRVQGFEVQVENGIAYAPVSVAAPIFLHIASGAGFSLLGPDGAPLAHFTMEGAPAAIGQAEGRCRSEALKAP